MKDYTIHTKDGQELSAATLTEAKRLAAKLKDKDPYIDEYSFDEGELTGRFWHYVNGKLICE